MRLGLGCSTLLYPRNLVSSGDYHQECKRISMEQSVTHLGTITSTYTPHNRANSGTNMQVSFRELRTEFMSIPGSNTLVKSPKVKHPTFWLLDNKPGSTQPIPGHSSRSPGNTAWAWAHNHNSSSGKSTVNQLVHAKTWHLFAYEWVYL